MDDMKWRNLVDGMSRQQTAPAVKLWSLAVVRVIAKLTDVLIQIELTGSMVAAVLK